MLGREIFLAALGGAAAPATTCAKCHAAPPCAVNLPCGHVFLCGPCSEAFRAAVGNVCPSCRRPSETVVPLAREAAATQVCAVCAEAWDSSHTFVAGACFHTMCVGCMTQAVRTALGRAAEWTEADAAGVACKAPNCQTRMGPGKLRDLVRVSQKALPDPRATRGFMEAGKYKEEPIAPLAQEEMDRLERFLQEAAIPPERKGQCQNVPACGRVLDIPRPAAGEEKWHPCPYC